MGAPPGLGPIVATIWHAFAARPHPAIQQSRAARLAAIIFIVEFTQQFLIVGAPVISAKHACGKMARFRGDNLRQNDDNRLNQVPPENSTGEYLSVIASRPSALFVAAIGTLVVLTPVRAHAQWWRSAPADFEECADAAEKSKTKEDKTAALAQCNAKFAGRRKPGGGYTYYDFMQDRTFDIAGPNPTPEEQKKIDEQYTAYLDRERRNTIAAALMAKQHQQPPSQVQQVSLRSEPGSARAEVERVPVPVASPVKQAARIRAANCAKSSFSCDWPRLSDGINGLKKMFSQTPPGKQKKT
jgi:hypothetical protein